MKLLHTPPRKRQPVPDFIEKEKTPHRCWVPFGRVYDRLRKKRQMSLSHETTNSSPMTTTSDPTEEQSDTARQISDADSNILPDETVDSDHPWLQDDTVSEMSLVPNDADVQRLGNWKRRLSRIVVRRQSSLSMGEPGLMRRDSSSPKLADDCESARFSVSSMSRRYSVQSNDHEVECTINERATGKRVTLDDFLPDKRPPGSQYPCAVHIGQISADDTASVLSSSLAVSFDDGYSQLILKQSISGETDDEESYDVDLNAEYFENRLGAAYSHPMGSPGAFDELMKKDVTCSPWVDEKIDQVWDRIDGTRCGGSSPMRSPVRVNTRQSSWNMGEDIRQSFSHDSSVVSFTSLLGGDALPTAPAKLPLSRTLWSSDNSPPYPMSSHYSPVNHAARHSHGSPIRPFVGLIRTSPMRRGIGLGQGSPMRPVARKILGSPMSKEAMQAQGSPMRCVAGVSHASPMRRRVVDRSRMSAVRRVDRFENPF